jgi:hypothetical protein
MTVEGEHITRNSRVSFSVVPIPFKYMILDTVSVVLGEVVEEENDVPLEISKNPSPPPRLKIAIYPLFMFGRQTVPFIW